MNPLRRLAKIGVLIFFLGVNALAKNPAKSDDYMLYRIQSVDQKLQFKPVKEAACANCVRVLAGALEKGKVVFRLFELRNGTQAQELAEKMAQPAHGGVTLLQTKGVVTEVASSGAYVLFIQFEETAQTKRVVSSLVQSFSGEE